jgi:hypothetical protein
MPNRGEQRVSAQLARAHPAPVQDLHPVDEFARAGRLARVAAYRRVADGQERLGGFGNQVLVKLELVFPEVELRDELQLSRGLREAKVNVKAAAKKRIRQLLFAVARDDDDGRVTGRAGDDPSEPVLALAELVLLLREFVDSEGHLVQDVEQVVGEVDIGFVNLVDQYDAALRLADCVAERPELDIRESVLRILSGGVLDVLQPAERIKTV